MADKTFNLIGQGSSQEELEAMIKRMQIAIKDDLDNISSTLHTFEKYLLHRNPQISPQSIQRLFVVRFLVLY